MEYLHSHQILHRDLKLHNLLLTKENNVVSAHTFSPIEMNETMRTLFEENSRFRSRQTIGHTRAIELHDGRDSELSRA